MDTISWEIFKKKDHLVELGVDGRIILAYILNIQVWRTWTGLSWLRI